MQALFCMENDPQVWVYGDLDEAPYTWEQMDRFVRTAPRGVAEQGQLRLVIELGGRVVGTVDLYGYEPLGRQAWVGILVWPAELRGRGIGLAALGLLVEGDWGVERFLARVDSTNGASCGLFRRAGFGLREQEGEHLIFECTVKTEQG